MEIKTEVRQELEFDKSEIPHLQDVRVEYYNGYFQRVCFKVREGNYFEIRCSYDAIKEIHHIFNKIIELQEGKNKAEH